VKSKSAEDLVLSKSGPKNTMFSKNDLIGHIQQLAIRQYELIIP